jgi:anti-sigma factor RsiW
MDCEKCQDEMSAYLDGELSAGRSSEVSEHVKCCRSCAEELSGLTRSSDFLEGVLNPIQPKQELWAQVCARISVAEPPHPAGWFSLRWLLGTSAWTRSALALAGTAAAAVIMVGGWGYVRQHESEKQLQQYVTVYAKQRQQQLAQIAPSATFGPAGASDGLTPASDQGKYDGNPFVEVYSTPYNNPFRAEEQR